MCIRDSAPTLQQKVVAKCINEKTDISYYDRNREKMCIRDRFMDYHDAHKQRRAGRQKAAQERLPDGDGHA